MKILNIFQTLVIAIILVLANFSIAEDEQLKEYSSLFTSLGDISIPESTKYHLQKYYTNAELSEAMRDLASKCGKLIKTYRIGTSVLGNPINVLKIGLNVDDDNHRPNFRMVANHHGDETAFRQILIAFTDYLCHAHLEKPGYSDEINLISKVNLYLIPTLNPDGYPDKRDNINGSDLNRNFPDKLWNSFSPSQKKTINLQSSIRHDSRPVQKENRVLMNFAESMSFVGSLSFHEGELVANYPSDGSSDGTDTYSKCDDDEAFKYLSRSYSYAHTEMYKSDQFKDGITNGAEWYPIYGSMQDWNYYQANQMELTLEISRDKSPPASELIKIFNQNIKALLTYPLVASYQGIHGYVFIKKCDKQKATCSKDLQPTDAYISVANSKFKIKSNKTHGQFFRPLAPGTYSVSASKSGYGLVREEITVPDNSSYGVQFNFTLQYGINLASVSDSVSERIKRVSKTQAIVVGLMIFIAACAPAAYVLSQLYRKRFSRYQGYKLEGNGSKIAAKI